MSSQKAPLVRYQHLVQVLAALARSSHAPEAVVRTVHQQAGGLFPAQITLLALLEPGGDWRWELYEGERRLTQRLPFYPDGILETVMREGPLLIGDIDAYLDTHPHRARRVVSEDQTLLDLRAEDVPLPPPRPTLSMLFVPLEVRGEPAGVLSMQSYDWDAFDSTDLEFLGLLAQHVSIALENAALREDLERASLSDPLTGLANRRAFGRAVAGALADLQRGESAPTLVVMDVHKFKTYNDTLGHNAGDDVLRRVAEVLREVTGTQGTAYRLGGDEFALLLRRPPGELAALVRRVGAALAAAPWPPGVEGVRLQGGAVQAGPGMTPREWLSQADARLYRAKRRVGDRTEANWGWGLDLGEG
ncbi:sensor domain-containing diguanylate cyclase [Deinococcus sp. MIMF12]|uniref:Sensor domain-containing diguanylate cyclase n=1 Tax=Deinococcus rhizophilus TaxID=3049544 RepID=A0ABT7JH29_9DEIO|nr:sensor domain-containing diguanylate cyclase [Deinococcus rhizophilus]MDL2344367.1 sensor domain-containing diguanylate cyclase [Deinococcus rhizophilus]